MQKISRTSFYFASSLIAVVLFGIFVWSTPVSAPTVSLPANTVATSSTTCAASGATGVSSCTTPDAKILTTHADASAAPKRVLVQGTYYTVVNLTSSGFSPRTITIHSGEPVRFVNLSSQSMRIVSNTDKSGPLYPSFYQAKSVGKNGVFDFLFDTPGTWGYHNLNSNVSGNGTVIVR